MKQGGQGGIDLSQIELTLKDDKYISSLNPADIKILRAAKALKEEWNSVFWQLQFQKFLDPQAIQFLKLIQTNKALGEIRVALYQ